MRTTLDIDASLLRRLRTLAHRRGESFKDVVAMVLRRGLEERTRPPGDPAPVFDMGAPLAGVDLDRALSLVDRLEDEEAVLDLRRGK